MRSRYSAFVLQNETYLLGTWHPDTRPSRVRFD
ncbi:MAG: zinc chelation protein SecC, partial [Luminiphilus sp.]|nr:zinc chelation protein SecC [Luminiphilus sp.]